MTLRQREFCRHYLAGMPATKAAHAAGYAPSVAEKNAAELLRAPRVQSYLARHRKARAVVHQGDLESCRSALLQIIRYCKDAQRQISAIRELRLLIAAQHSLYPEELQPLTEVDEWIESPEFAAQNAVENPDDETLARAENMAFLHQSLYPDIPEIEPESLVPTLSLPAEAVIQSSRKLRKGLKAHRHRRRQVRT